MKILAYSDLHGNKSALRSLKKKAKEADLIIDAGDMTIFEHEIKDIINEIDSFKKPVVMVHGNHESSTFLKGLCEKKKNIKFIHKKVEIIDGIAFIGYGGGGFAYSDMIFDKFSKTVMNKIKTVSKVVLVLHGPPYGTKLDEIWDEHAGNKSYTKFIKKAKPDLVICGHLHENSGVVDHIGKSRIINPGPSGKIIRI